MTRTSPDKRLVTTLNALALYVGYCDWEAFCQRNKSEGEVTDTSSLFYGRKHLIATNLFSGDVVKVLWRPNRCVTLRYSGNQVFLVTESQNSKLAVGDTFKCNYFVEHMPLVLVDLIHDSQAPCEYICGMQGGVTFSVIK